MGRQANNSEHVCITDIHSGSLALFIRLEVPGIDRLKALSMEVSRSSCAGLGFASVPMRCAAYLYQGLFEYDLSVSPLAEPSLAQEAKCPRSRQSAPSQDRLRLWLLCWAAGWSIVRPGTEVGLKYVK